MVGARQYIGARYVPIFGRAGEHTVEWDDGAPYEPLTVVMHQGVSYVSRRYVPQGIQITDTDYWVQTYRFNAQVEQYRQEVLGFADDIADRVPFPDPVTYPKYGTLGQVLTTLANGSTKWENPVVPSDEQAEEVITAWLDEHPEATTTVTDNSLELVKLSNTAKLAIGNLVMEPATRIAFSGNTAGTDPLVVSNLSLVYYTYYGSSATADSFLNVAVSPSTLSIANNHTMVFDCGTKTISVLDNAQKPHLTPNQIVLLWKQGTVIKGHWAWMYYDSVLSSKVDYISSSAFVEIAPDRLMCRQGEGYGYPDNSIMGVKAALNDGFKNIRISCAHTSDGVCYATHY